MYGITNRMITCGTISSRATERLNEGVSDKGRDRHSTPCKGATDYGSDVRLLGSL